MKRPELPPHYTTYTTAHSDEAVRLCDEYVELPESELSHGYDPEHGRVYPTREDAAVASWVHWREHGDEAWVAYLDSLEADDTPKREPFDGWKEVSDEQREIAQREADRLAPIFEAAKLLPPTVDDVVFAAHLQQLAQAVRHEPGAKSSKLVAAVFSDKTPQGQASSVMLAQLLRRPYSAPYHGLNVAGMDFVNVFVVVIAVAYSGLKSTPKFGSKAKGKRPQ